MDSEATLAFAQRLMAEVWEPYDDGAVSRFYRRDVIGHNGKQRLSYDDVIHRLVTDRTRYPILTTAYRTSSRPRTSGLSGSSSPQQARRGKAWCRW